MDVAGLLHLLRAEPTLMDPAPEGAGGDDVQRRTRGEVHDCLRCGQRATTALIALVPGHGRRWLDLCPQHFHEVSRGA
jgi:hypothetical protein